MGGKPRFDLLGSHLHFDGVSGCAGDMFVAAMIDLGVPTEVVTGAVRALGHDLDVRIAKVVRGGIAATDVGITARGVVIDELNIHERGHEHAHAHEHGHGHDHRQGGDHGHRHYTEIRADLVAACLGANVTARALDIFDRIARAEAALHAQPLDQVAFHELGALDALADVAAAAAAIEWLQPRGASAAAVAVGSGRIKTAHGFLPVPSPAALAILTEAGAAIDASPARVELCTPTGAAILASIVSDWSGPPVMSPRAVGYGAGDLELGDRPNVFRVTAARLVVGDDEARDRVSLVECNIDDLSGELCAYAADAARAAGALDVWWTPATMKKGRPAAVLSALSERARLPAVLDALFAESSTLGVRISELDRIVLARESVQVSTRFGSVSVKIGRRAGRVMNVAPEFESCRTVAEKCGAALKEVYAAALVAASSIGLASGGRGDQ